MFALLEKCAFFTPLIVNQAATWADDRMVKTTCSYSTRYNTTTPGSNNPARQIGNKDPMDAFIGIKKPHQKLNKKQNHHPTDSKTNKND